MAKPRVILRGVMLYRGLGSRPATAISTVKYCFSKKLPKFNWPAAHTNSDLYSRLSQNTILVPPQLAGFTIIAAITAVREKTT